MCESSNIFFNYFENFIIENDKGFRKELTISTNNPIVGKKISEIELPKAAVIILIVRKNEFITPKGSTIILAKDKLLVTTNSLNGIKRIESVLYID